MISVSCSKFISEGGRVSRPLEGGGVSRPLEGGGVSRPIEGGGVSRPLNNKLKLKTRKLWNWRNQCILCCYKRKSYTIWLNKSLIKWNGSVYTAQLPSLMVSLPRNKHFRIQNNDYKRIWNIIEYNI